MTREEKYVEWQRQEFTRRDNQRSAEAEEWDKLDDEIEARMANDLRT